MVLCNCSLFGSALLCVNSSFAIILIGKRELAALLSLSSWCIVIVVWIFLAVPLVLSAVSGISCHTHLLFFVNCDWVDHEACSLSHYIIVITNLALLLTELTFFRIPKSLHWLKK